MYRWKSNKAKKIFFFDKKERVSLGNPLELILFCKNNNIFVVQWGLQCYTSILMDIKHKILILQTLYQMFATNT